MVPSSVRFGSVLRPFQCVLRRFGFVLGSFWIRFEFGLDSVPRSISTDPDLFPVELLFTLPFDVGSGFGFDLFLPFRVVIQFDWIRFVCDSIRLDSVLLGFGLHSIQL